MIANSSVKPPDVPATRKRKGWKRDPQGRLIFRPRGLYGSAYVVVGGSHIAAQTATWPRQ